MRLHVLFPILAALLLAPLADASAKTPAQYYILGPGESLPTYHVGQKMTGTSAWYGQRLQGNRTADGGRFDWHKMTAAHRTLPFGTKIRVTYLKNGRSEIVTVTDRGPSSRRYILDVSRGVAEKLGMKRAGTGTVTIEILELPRWYRSGRDGGRPHGRR